MNSSPHFVFPHVALAREFWRVRTNGGGFATAAVLLLLLIFHFIFRRSRSTRSSSSPAVTTSVTTSVTSSSASRIGGIVTDADLDELIRTLNEDPVKEKGNWEDVIEKKNNSIGYQAWRYKNPSTPPKYYSVTTFTNCSPEILRDFYMDNEFRKDWDSTIASHNQIETDGTTGTEIGRTVKKFPFLTPREYVLAWRVWEGKDGRIYCFTKECDHQLAPKQRNYVRVSHFRSGWCISKVPGTDSCEIRLVHSELNGMNIEMAKIAFAKGIWNYVCKTDRAFRSYSASYSVRNNSPSLLSMRSLIQKVPPSLEIEQRSTPSGISVNNTQQNNNVITKQRKMTKMPSGKWIANGLLVAGTVICLSKGRSTLGAQLAMACILKKLNNKNEKNKNMNMNNSNEGNSNMDKKKNKHWINNGNSSSNIIRWGK